MEQLFVIHQADNVAVALEDILEGNTNYAGALKGALCVKERIPRGHKVAIRQIAAGEAVIKHGYVIAEATDEISAGRWVHTHNAKSPGRQEADV